MSKQNLLGYTRGQMEDIFVSLGEKAYHGKQLFKWLYNNQQYDFQLMSDMSKELRNRLDNEFEFRPLELRQEVKSTDGTEKYLFALDDGHPIETVLIPEAERSTLCISSQAGCALACSFCATGKMGFVRNLTVGEMIGQLMYVRDRRGSDSFTNVVFMGMGEPFNNYDNTLNALDIMCDHSGLGIAARRVTVSTVGIIPKIRKYAESGQKANLALSLHAATQEKRERLVPVAKKYPLDELIDALCYYTGITKRRVMIEYILFAGINDSKDDALALARLLQGLPCKINVLTCNPVAGLGFDAPSDEIVDTFVNILYPRAPAVTVRKSRGQDIDAACGQLAAKAD
ncbi:MAG: 23S rRNA (adenine(2503)-C(2))-methyltransferase RlmN [candidate division Zixibacteria bacterium]|nr:23S rRNA (adenine(2503)-C(2))-methyltransferase RlmN [candidate division Zixibacteria bacterium]